MSNAQYIHGYDAREQDRLIAQAAFWEDLIVDGLSLGPSDALLEIGCGAGAVLGVLGRAFPQASFAGIDIAPEQIDRAITHLAATCPGTAADLRVGDGARLPWPDETFTHVYLIWVLEHMKDPGPILREACRVLKPGGRITLTETDYNFVIHPEHVDYAELMLAWRQLFAARGSAVIARVLGPALLEAGFTGVGNRVVGLHYFAQPGDDGLRRATNYIADFMEPECDVMAESQGRDAGRLKNGTAVLRSLAEHRDGALTGTIYRGVGVKPG